MSLASKGKAKSATHRKNISKGTTGKPKPWCNGERNPNFGNKAQDSVREKFLAASKKRGLAWSDEDRDRHRAFMLGPGNQQRGKSHTPETIAKISAIKLQQYRDGTINFRRYRLSSAETEIAEFLTTMGVEFEQQFHIKGESFLYDFYMLKQNTLVEYNGDYWHANPRKYKSGSMLKIQNMGSVLVDDIWKRDAEKRLAAERHGFVVRYIWEDVYKSQGLEVLRWAI
jgi:G:T-mismatch repair DNA endonuclease (very short patch repair protein)